MIARFEASTPTVVDVQLLPRVTVPFPELPEGEAVLPTLSEPRLAILIVPPATLDRFNVPIASALANVPLLLTPTSRLVMEVALKVRLELPMTVPVASLLPAVDLIPTRSAPEDRLNVPLERVRLPVWVVVALD